MPRLVTFSSPATAFFLTAMIGLGACGDRAIDGDGVDGPWDDVGADTEGTAVPESNDPDEDWAETYGHCGWVDVPICDTADCMDAAGAAQLDRVVQSAAVALGLGGRLELLRAGSEDGSLVWATYIYRDGWFSAPIYLLVEDLAAGPEPIEAELRRVLATEHGPPDVVDRSLVDAALQQCELRLKMDPCSAPRLGRGPEIEAAFAIDGCRRRRATVDATTGELTQCELIDGCEGLPDDFPEDPGSDTPLVLRFDDAPAQLLPAFEGTRFDIRGDGACTGHDWPTARTPWLVLDRDGDGAIASGNELFGSGTLLPSGRRARDGFEALAQLDTNNDGQISRADARFGELALWGDSNGDKRSDPGELIGLAEAGVVSIELDLRRDPVCDARGNCAVERASFVFVDGSGRPRSGEVVDLHLACR